MAAMGSGAIVIDPFDRSCLGTNSYDVHLAPTLRTYELLYDPCETPSGAPAPYDRMFERRPLDVRESRTTVDVPIPAEGIVLLPGKLYLASTVEHTESHEHVPMLNGRSSLGRLGLSIHVTAGTGDVGFRGCWTMEMFVVEPLRVYAGMSVGQLLWMTTSSDPLVSYDHKSTAKYNDAGALPQASKMHEELSSGSGGE
jgi:dCTP deaminase